MPGLDNLNDHGKTIKRFAGRKGGRRRVKKGFAMMDKDRLREITSMAGKKGMESRWRGNNKEPVGVHDTRKASNVK